ncbi:hypothetical protein TCSYLVIO_000921 [Trypanosoma cruzi]|nr:hypothetical protein TCSYLVIO_000921 [Trypanosoma cruzi]
MKQSLSWSISSTRGCASCVSYLLEPSVATCARGTCWEDAGAIVASAWEALANYYSARLSTSGVCPHTVDGRAHSAAGWAGGRQSAARWSARICGAHIGRRFRRRQPRAGHRSQGGTAPPTQRVPCDPQGARRHVEEWAGIASCLCAEPPLGARCPGQHQEQSPRRTERRLSRVGRAFLFSWASLRYGHLTAARMSTCQIGLPSCGRDRAIMASSSAASLRGIPQCDGENMKFTE